MISNPLGFGIKKMALLKHVYDTNLNFLGVRSQEDRVRREEIRRKSSRRESFLFALLSGHDIIPQITNAKKNSSSAQMCKYFAHSLPS
ncbi:hypothetical protein [Okeania sp. SIO2C2]|uniref:hypothetical protein n=1 Tax=Okeania sp. SIO2C2 TaxID=2607787 RepID=UPI00257A5BDE|nr:hypothetical protein [Okeania sp. SIO2C2]